MLIIYILFIEIDNILATQQKLLDGQQMIVNMLARHEIMIKSMGIQHMSEKSSSIIETRPSEINQRMKIVFPINVISELVKFDQLLGDDEQYLKFMVSSM